MFDIGQSNVNIKFQNILNDFIPRYLEVLSNYKISIDEIRIEGHISFEWRYKIRVEQGLIKDNISSWEEVYKYSDTALCGIINMLERNQASIPRLHKYLDKTKVEMLWIRYRVGISLEAETIEVKDYTIFSHKDIIENTIRFLNIFKEW